MNDKKICFIMCVNNQQYVQEALYYINRLWIPEGYTVETLSVEDAPGMAAGYNTAMMESDAKYKIYLHQDVFIVEKEFLKNILDIFRNPEVGMIGMVGAPKLPPNGVMWYAPCIGKIYQGEPNGLWYQWSNEGREIEGKYQSVEMVDGLLMATQYDIPWREDLFDGWDFYDASQSQEFMRKGYQIVVPKMEHPWCVHDSGKNDLKNYWKQRKKFMQEYKKT
jgi:hypothetical protein